MHSTIHSSPVPRRVGAGSVAALIVGAVCAVAVPEARAQTAAAAPAAQNATKPIVLHHVRGNLYALEGKGGNSAFYATGDGVILVDTKNNGADIAEEILDLIRSVTDEPVKYVINTHYHQDHMGNNEYFQSLGAQIISTANAREHVQGPVWQTTRIYDLDGNFVRDEPYSRGTAEGRWRPVAASLVFTDELTIALGGKEVRLRQFGPSHTDGDLFVFFPEERALAVGDNLKNPFCGVCVDYHAGGTLLGYIALLESLLELPGSEQIADLDAFDIVLTGHGDVTTDRAGLLEHRDKLVELRDLVLEAKALGKSYREIAETVAAKYGWKPEDRNLGQWTFPGIMAELQFPPRRR